MINLINQLNDILWGYIVIAMMVCCALYFTIKTKAVQFSMIGEMWRLLTHSTKAEALEAGYAEGETESDSQQLNKWRRRFGFKQQADNRKKPISPFRAFAVGLSSRVGTGNLAGVASAIFIGGPGAVFWMWVMALLGASSSFVESTLAQLYKKRDPKTGVYYGGPAYYMQWGLNKRWMGIIFAVLITLSYSLATQMIQSKTMADAFSVDIEQMFSLAPGSSVMWVGVAVTVATALIIFGGIQRISRFAALVVPFMAVGYLLLAAYVILTNITAIPRVFELIVSSAFGIDQAAGGMVGVAVMQGVKRGLFSNEAGEGSVPNAAAIAETSHPVKQGLLQALGVFCDTIVICSCTAFIVLISGLYDSGLDGILLTSKALETEVGSVGRYFLTVAILLFAYSTIIAGYFYGETNIRFIFGKNGNTTYGSDKKEAVAIFFFRVVTAIVIMIGSMLSLQDAFSIVDLLMGFMTITNLIAIIWLSPRVMMLLNDYRAQRKAGKDPVFSKTTLPQSLQQGVECW